MENDLTIKELARYYRNEPVATNKAIMQFLRDSRPDTIVFGARAVNARLPEWLERETQDWDILSRKDAKDMAVRLEKVLDKRYGGDFFIVDPAKHEGTFKVRSRVTRLGVADISPREGRVDFDVIKGINYTSLEFQEKEAKRILEDPEFTYRHGKDRDTLQRIQVFRSTKGKRRASGRGRSVYIDGSPEDTSMSRMR
jgi:hypothetical protein